jgi:hypothetical protein
VAEARDRDDFYRDRDTDETSPSMDSTSTFSTGSKFTRDPRKAGATIRKAFAWILSVFVPVEKSHEHI